VFVFQGKSDVFIPLANHSELRLWRY